MSDSPTRQYRHYVPKIRRAIERLCKDPNLTNNEIADKLNEKFPDLNMDGQLLSKVKYGLNHSKEKTGAYDKYSKKLFSKVNKEYRNIGTLVRDVNKKYEKLSRLIDKIEKHEKEISKICSSAKVEKERKYGSPFDDIIMAGFHQYQGEILSMIYSEDEDADVSYNWVGVRKAFLKKKYGVPKAPKEEKTVEKPEGEERKYVAGDKKVAEKKTDGRVDGVQTDRKMGRPLSPKMKYVEAHLDTPAGELAESLNEKFPDVNTTENYVSLMKNRIRKRLGTETSGASYEPKSTGQEETSEKKPVKVDYTHKDVLEPEKIVEPKTGRRGRPPSPRMKFIEENLEMDSATLIDEVGKRFPNTKSDYVYAIKSVLKKKVATERKLKSQTHIDTYEEKVEEPTKDYGTPAWKIPLKHEVDVMQPTVGIMRSIYVPTEDLKVINLDTLSIAIKNSIDEVARSRGYDGVTNEQAGEMAQHVLNFFGYSDFIIDNILEQEDRDAFYMLEDAGLLKNEREETTLYDGREWRIHYWLLNRKRINELAKNYHPANNRSPENVPADEVYSDENTWKSIKEVNGSGVQQLTGQERDVIYRKKRRGELYVSSQPFANSTS